MIDQLEFTSDLRFRLALPAEHVKGDLHLELAAIPEGLSLIAVFANHDDGPISSHVCPSSLS